MTGIAMFLAFLFLHHAYIRDIIYEERLNQMEEITHQMFQNRLISRRSKKPNKAKNLAGGGYRTAGH